MIEEARAAPPSPAADRRLCEAALPHVSRTFALCIRFLPDELEYSVLVAYLLCRIADTIEDSPELGEADQRRLLATFRDALGDGGRRDVAAIESAFAEAASHDERLARDAAAVLREFGRLPIAHREAIRPWVQEMCDGMAEFVSGPLRRDPAAPGALRALPDVAALDRYCYFVAGTVGHLLSALFRQHFRSADAERDRRLESLAGSFGLGLQLTNIVKDAAVDRERGVSFVPEELCLEAGIDAARLTDPASRAEARAVVARVTAMARRHLDDAITYCTYLPRDEYGIRRFCLVSVFLAARTLALVPRDPRLMEPGHTVKITRAEVTRTVLAASAIAPSNALVRRYYRALIGPA
jgi:farnesyl-diphosphate farnesyltransferase